MECQCGKNEEMDLIHQNHDDSYIDHWWCHQCGRILIRDEDSEWWRVPESAKRRHENEECRINQDTKRIAQSSS